MIIAVLCLTTITAAPCYAAYYSKTAKFVDIPNTSDVQILQGMTAGTRYIYSIKINKANTKSAIFKTDMVTKKTIQMKNANTGLLYNTYLKHGNDMTGLSIDGFSNLYVVDRGDGVPQVIKLKVNGSEYEQVAKYRTTLDGSPLSMVAIDLISKTSSEVTFLFKRGNAFYTGSIGLRDGNGDIKLKRAFRIDKANALVNGKTIPSIEEYTPQGIEYSGDKLYVTLWGRSVDGKTELAPNTSIILVYNNIVAAIKQEGIPTLKASDTSFQIVSSLYAKYEIEGCCIAGGTMYITANRGKLVSDITNMDTAICYFIDY